MRLSSRLTCESGYHASTATEYAAAFRKALSLEPKEAQAMRLRARKSAQRFSNAAFAKKWIANLYELVRTANVTGPS